MDDDAEFALLARLAPFLTGAGGDVLVGHGDDAAVVSVGGRPVILCVDVVVDGVHFRRDVSTLEDVGWKAVAVNCSDVAAMGGRPSVALVGLCRPADLPGSDVEALYRGMEAACRRWGLRLVGGDTVAAPALAVSVTVLGDVDDHRVVPRDGAVPGQALVVVGALGAAAAGLAQVAAGAVPDPALLQAHVRPRALVDAGRVLAEAGATAMIDLSDGLGRDLGHVCAASGVAARVRAADLPLAAGVAEAAAALHRDPLELAVGGGEDFALLAALPAERAEAALAAAMAAEGVPGAIVGEVLPATDGVRVGLLLPDGSTRDISEVGYEHDRPAGQEHS